MRVLAAVVSSLLFVGCASQGEPGPAGPQGERGPPGGAGPTGPQGAVLLVQLDDGGSVSLDAGLAIVVGPQGPAGPPGQQGATGPQGAVLLVQVDDGGTVAIDGGFALVTGPSGPTGAQGPAGQSVAGSTEGPSTNCPTGGARFDTATQTVYACNGAAGTPGAPGATGAPGTSVTSTVLPVGDSTCPYGGTRFSSASGDSFACSGPPADREQFLRGSALATADATLDGFALATDRLVLSGGGYGAGVTDLVVTAANSPYVLLDGLHEFRNVTVEAGATLTALPWNGASGGSLRIVATGTVTIDGAINLSGRGYRGGVAQNANNLNQWSPQGTPGEAGESYVGPPNARLPGLANGGGGAGGGVDTCTYGAGAGGAGYGTAGVAASSIGGGCAYGYAFQSSSFPFYSTGPAAGGVGGATYGDASISTLQLGSGGGAAGSDADCTGGRGGHGGRGGGAVSIEARTLTLSGTIDVSGQAGGNALLGSNPCGYPGDNGGGGGGSGGSLRLRARTLTLLSGSTLNARGGAGGLRGTAASTNGGAGGDGRVRLEAVTLSNAATIGLAVPANVSSATGAPNGAGDATAGTWVSPLITEPGAGRFKTVDLFAVRGEGTHLAVELCTGTSAAQTLDPNNCRPVAMSGAVDAPAGANYARVRLSAIDRPPNKRFALLGLRTVFGE